MNSDLLNLKENKNHGDFNILLSTYKGEITEAERYQQRDRRSGHAAFILRKDIIKQAYNRNGQKYQINQSDRSPFSARIPQAHLIIFGTRMQRASEANSRPGLKSG